MRDPLALAALDETTRLQNLASSPASSVWVSANAGSGKTHVLTQRVIRLMLAGSRPSSILCLTYTKAAASEMSNRVFERLSRWTSLGDVELSTEIAEMEGQVPDRIKLMDARRLFARALETPGGLKIQTIHAFCEALLHQFPLEANVAGHFNVLDGKAATSLLAEARRGLLTATQEQGDTTLAAAFYDVLTIADESGLNRLLADIIGKRGAISRFLSAAKQSGGTAATLRQHLHLDPAASKDGIAARAWPLPDISDHAVQDYVGLANSKGGVKPQETAYQLNLARGEDDPVKRLDLLRQTFLKKSDELPYADPSIFSAAMKKDNPALCGKIGDARMFVLEAWQAFKTFRMYEATLSALTLAERLIANYEALKKSRGFLDFEDFIDRTEALLKKDQIGPWVHYKLDQGIDHILVDEAQDTSPSQWEIIRSLSEEFFAGDGARAINRTIFAVGDEKQSIYSFQGARPERFADERRTTERRAGEAGKAFAGLNLRVSFRSTEDVLTAVDTVFAIPDTARGLSADGEAVGHVSNRIGQPGAVDIWETIAEEGREDDEEDWLAPFDRLPERSSASELARRMAANIRDMVGRETLQTKNGARLVEAGDVLVLVRKRDAFAAALAKELKKTSGVPVAGTDRLVLSSHIAIQDLMALARFAMLPEDDLSLAELIKSPLLNLGEDDVGTLCIDRNAGETVWERLHTLARKDAGWAEVLGKLTRWKNMAGTLRVYDFYAALLGREGGRRKFLARFGHEVSDVLDEFLNFALAHETAGLPGLTSFVTTLELESPEIKREQDKGRNEVRIMTVHASKGLEAAVVFLVDGGSRPFDKNLLPKLRLVPTNEPGVELPLWIPNKDYSSEKSAQDDIRIEQAALEEYRRLLYVGMTRASDRLILCSYRKKTDQGDTWAKLTANALAADGEKCLPATFRAGGLEWAGYRWRHTAGSTAIVEVRPKVTDDEQSALPDSLYSALPPMPALPRPLAPSGVHAIIDEGEGDRIVTSALFGEKASGGAEIKGKIVHRLLQALPDVAEAGREDAALRYLARAVPHWSEPERLALAGNVLGILANAHYAGLFSSGSRAEVSVMGTIRLKDRDFAVSGRIDRMGVLEKDVFILDYKTNRVPPPTRADIPFAHRAQLALYREVLLPLFAGKRVHCLLIYTEDPHLYALSEAELGKALLDISAK